MAPQVIAHRGASAEATENSLTAFRRAVAAGADAIELDVHATSDGAFVVHHDAALPGAGDIAELTLGELRQSRLANGEPVPTLDEALEASEGADVWVELKALDARYDTAFVRLLQQAPHPDRYSVHSFDHRVVRRLSMRHPELRCGALLAAYLLDPVRELADSGASVLWQEWSLIDRQLVDRVHESGRTIIAWTVDGAADLLRLASLGVDGLCTNFPHRALRVLGR